MISTTILRVARPTDNLADVIRFYEIGLGLTRLSSFQDHEGFDGVMLGIPGSPYHLEFTHNPDHVAGRAPTQDNLLVFYFSNHDDWRLAIARMSAAGYASVPSFNPYWDRFGQTFQDPDGYRVVLNNGSSPV
jgi:hypothetical protein